MSEIRGQRSEVRSQKSDDSRRKTNVGWQRLEVGMLGSWKARFLICAHTLSFLAAAIHYYPTPLSSVEVQDAINRAFQKTQNLSPSFSVNPSCLGTETDILTPEHGNTDFRSKSYFRDSGVRLREPSQNHLT
jgi:hypothetical protein